MIRQQSSTPSGSHRWWRHRRVLTFTRPSRSLLSTCRGCISSSVVIVVGVDVTISIIDLIPRRRLQTAADHPTSLSRLPGSAGYMNDSGAGDDACGIAGARPDLRLLSDGGRQDAGTRCLTRRRAHVAVPVAPTPRRPGRARAPFEHF